MLCCFHAEDRRPSRKATESAKSSAGSQYLSRAVSKSLKVLELLQSARSPMALHEIARRIQLSKTSTFRLLRTLEAAGCLVPPARANTAWPRESILSCPRFGLLAYSAWQWFACRS